tara:strand:+ start:489 stop:653 length:165 start_codon:yes stop_codon:yes gene_type:complete
MPENKRVDDRRKKDRKTHERRDIKKQCPEKLEPHHGGHIPKEGLKKIKKSQGGD